MAILIKGMEMPKQGLYFVGVDNSNGRDKTVITVERMLGNRDIRHIVGSFELITVPEPHGRLGDLTAAEKQIDYMANLDWNKKVGASGGMFAALEVVEDAPTIIPASEEG